MTDRRDKSGPWNKMSSLPWAMEDIRNNIPISPYGATELTSVLKIHFATVEAIENMMKVRI